MANIILPLDFNYNVENYTLVLANKSLKKIGAVSNAYDITYRRNGNSANELSFSVRKYLDGEANSQWDNIKDLQCVYVVEIDEYFVMDVSVSEDTSTNVTKTVTCTSLCESELSQILLHDIEINTKEDILREEYTTPTVLYSDNHKNSLLHRILEKAPHYKIGFVSESLKKIQRSFSINGTSIYDFLTNTLATEINCILIFDSTSRIINVYDLYYYCTNCKERHEHIDSTCPSCRSSDITPPYGKEAGIFISIENLANNITVESNMDSIKNCFKLKGGDALLTSTVRSINPNGSDYIYYYSDEMKKTMPINLVGKLDEYDNTYNDFLYTKQYTIENDEIRNLYNGIVDKYNHKKYAQYKYNEDDEKVLTNNSFLLASKPIVGYEKITALLFDLIDANLYLTSSLMPTVIFEEVNAKTELAKLNESSLSPIGLSTMSSSTGGSTVESAIKNYSKAFVKGNYKVSVKTTEYDYIGTDEEGYHYANWTGSITLTSYKDETDTATSELIRLKVYNNYAEFIDQKIKKQLRSDDDEYGSIYDVMSIPYSESDTDFKNALQYYSLNRLQSFNDAFQSGVDILIEIDQANPAADLYEKLYLQYKNRVTSIENEISIRKQEIDTCDTMIDEINKIIEFVQKSLDLKLFLGNELWLTFNAYRREDVYENSNFVSDGLNNKQLIDKAKEFTDLATRELITSATTQYVVTGDINNLLALKEFKDISHNFDVFNWIRLKVDNNIYKLRLMSIQVSFNDMQKIDIEFSTLVNNNNYLSDVESILSQAKSMSTNFPYIEYQSSKGQEASTIIKDWFDDGLDATNIDIMNSAKNQNVIMTKNGLLCRSYDDISNSYADEQLKIINSTIAMTKDNWKTVDTAIGKIKYVDPLTSMIREGYGVNTSVLVGKLILGESLGLYSEDATLAFDNNGLLLNSINKNGKFTKVIRIQRNGKDKVYIDDDGNLVLNDITANNITANDGTFKGSIIANAGSIGDFLIQNGKITSDILTFDPKLGEVKIYNEKLENNEGFTVEELNINISGISGWKTGFNRFGVDLTGIYGGTGDPCSLIWFDMNGACTRLKPNDKKFYVDGDIHATNFSNMSLASLKENIALIPTIDCLKSVLKTDVFGYNYKNDKQKRNGFVIGKDFNLDSKLLSGSKDSVDLYAAISISYGAIQHQQKEINKLSKKIKKLTEYINLIKNNEKGTE